MYSKSVKRTSLTLSLLLLFAGGVVSQVPDEVHEKCKDARDYVGCIQVLTGATISKEEAEIEEIKNLKKALALLPSRLENTSLRDFSMAIQPFTDALAAAEAVAIGGSDYSLEDKTKILKLTNPSLRLSSAVDIFRSTLRMGIEFDSEVYPSVIGSKYVSCNSYDFYIDAFNQMFESNVINYHSIESRAFNAGCYLNKISLYDGSGKPMYREYEGTMLYWIIEAVNEITATGKFPVYLNPYKTLEELSVDYIEKIQIETREEIAKYKKINQALEEPYQLSNTIKNYTKKEFIKILTGNRHFGKTMVLNTKGEYIFENGLGYYRGGVKKSNREKSKEALKKKYALDYELAINNKWFGESITGGFPIGGINRYASICLNSTNLGQYYYGALDGDKNANLYEAKKLFVATLSIDIEKCKICYDEKGNPNISYYALLHYRNVSKRYLEEIKRKL